MRTRLKSSATASRINRAVPLSLLAHAALAGVIVLAALRVPRKVAIEAPDVVAQVELRIGDGARQTGTPPAASPTSPAPPTPSTPAPPAPPAPPPSPQAGQSPPPPASPPPAPQAMPQPPAPPEIRLGDGDAAPPAEIEDPLSFVKANADTTNVAPQYPPDAARRHETGRVQLALHVDAQGRVVEAEIVQSSGSPSLDQAARRQLQTWHFRPAFKDGHAVPSIVQQGIAFTD